MPGEVLLHSFIEKPPAWLSYPESIQLFNEIEKSGGQCRFVGGCVRDALMGSISDDLDICTDLTPESVLENLGSAGIRVIPTGLKHGTVTALMGDHKFEITTLRRDIKTYGRHADVSFTKSWEEDASRRDFTINALYADLSGKLFDYFGGQDDLAAGNVRFIGDAGERIKEDRLRVLRFFRFFARFGKGEANVDALNACKNSADQLQLLSGERVSKELFLILSHASPLKALELMRETGVLAALLNQTISLDLLKGLLKLPVPTEPINRLAVLISRDRQETLHVSQDLRLSAKAQDRLLKLCVPPMLDTISTHEQKESLYGNGIASYKDQLLMSWSYKPDSKEFRKYWALAEEWGIPTCPVLGRDLLDHGMSPGPEIGATLKKLEKIWIDSDFSLNREQLLAQF